MKIGLISVAGLVLSSVAGLGEGTTLTLTPSEAFKDSDVVALVRVMSTAPLPDTGGRYTKTAHLEVIEPIKGPREKEQLDLDYDTAGISPNVLYTEDEKALVVLRRLSNGHYETMGAYCGKFTVEEGEVLDCYLLGEPGKVPTSVPIDEAVRRLRILVAQSKELSE